jgi:hypothetical protein
VTKWIDTRVLKLLAIALVLAMIPGLVLMALGYGDGSTLTVFAAVAGLIACVTAGWRVAALAVTGLAVATAVVMPLAEVPWAAATVLAAVSAIVAYSSRRGIASGLMLVPIALAFTVTDPPLDTLDYPQRALVAALAVLGAGVFAVVATRLLVHQQLPAGDCVSQGRAALYAAIIAVLVWLATWIVILNDLGLAGAWSVMTILLVVQPYLQDGWQIAMHRAVGTLVGFAIALSFVVVSGLPVIIYASGGVFLYLAMMFKFSARPYWQYAALVTPAVVLLEGASGSLDVLAWQRLVATVVAVLASLVVMLLARPLYLAGARRHDLERW